MLIKELLESIYPYKWTLERGSRSVASFTTKDDTSVAVHFGNSSVTNVTQVIFYRGLNSNTTGEGDAFKIFATVIAIVKDFHRKHPDEGIAFEADENDAPRISLYTKFASKFSKMLGMSSKHIRLENGVCFIIARQPLLDRAADLLSDRGYLEP